MNFPPVHPALNLEPVRAMSGFHMAPPAPCSTSVLQSITVAAPASTCSHSQGVFIFRVYGLRLTCDCNSLCRVEALWSFLYPFGMSTDGILVHIAMLVRLHVCSFSDIPRRQNPTRNPYSGSQSFCTHFCTDL